MTQIQKQVWKDAALLILPNHVERCPSLYISLLTQEPVVVI